MFLGQCHFSCLNTIVSWQNQHYWWLNTCFPWLNPKKIDDELPIFACCQITIFDDHPPLLSVVSQDTTPPPRHQVKPWFGTWTWRWSVPIRCASRCCWTAGHTWRWATMPSPCGGRGGMGVASGKHTESYGKSLFLMGKLQFLMGKSLFLMGKSTISMAIFNSFLYVYQRVASVTGS